MPTREIILVEVMIRLVGDTASFDLENLFMWLTDEDELRGNVTVPLPPIRSSEMGTLADTLIVTLGAQGARAVLATAVSTWIRHRRPSVDIELTREGCPSVKIAVRNGPPQTVDRIVRKALES